MRECKICRSMAVNPHSHGREDGVDLDLCDVCYWRTRAERYEKALIDILDSIEIALQNGGQCGICVSLDMKPWAQARKKVDSVLRIHDLRHAYAIKLAESGCPMHFISEVLGHSNTDFTRKRYARFSPESASRAVLRVLEVARG